jgi:hypothetical protein
MMHITIEDTGLELGCYFVTLSKNYQNVYKLSTRDKGIK